MTPPPASSIRRTPLFLLAALALVGASGCAGSKKASSTPSTSLSLAPVPSAAASPGQRGQRPGVSGVIAAIDKTTLQVQDGTSTQTAVSYTSKTLFTQSVPATLADVKVGSCVAVTSADAGSAGTSTSPNAPVAAGRVTISTPVSGVCTGGFGGGPGGGQGFPGGFARRSGAPGAGGTGGPAQGGGVRPSGTPGGGAFRGANGLVTSVDASGFVVQNTPRAGGGGTSPSAGSSAAPAVSTNVTVSAATVLSKPKPATAAALKVGECVTAQGTTDSTGAVTATFIAIRAADAAGCGQRRGAPSGVVTNG
ncbi:MAG: DUF5666 domain-containing protein [Actinomycetota bacterium]